MHIKKLEICGFKSFVDKTVVHFDHDVIGIVGPNGCGKSNIVDAIRWCMGEQSAKHLRGKSMDDVIFSGSDSRGPAGFSEVTLTFDNSDPVEASALPPEFAAFPEIGVSRRLFRDGTSEYLINRTQVRLRDITDLFLGTGVGTKAYSIVEQGRIGQIVSARAEDRRLFIEEAAGITKYKQRRKQAERKMELTRQNLLRLTDIVSEIERTRSLLKRQVAKAERFIRYRRELEDLELHDRAHQLLRLLVVGRVEREALSESRDLAERARSQLHEADAALDSARLEAATIEESARLAASAAFSVDGQVNGLAADIEHCTERLEHLSLRLTTGRSELDLLQNRVQELASEREELELRLRSLAENERARESDAATEAETLSQLQAEELEGTQIVFRLRQEVNEASKQAATAEVRIDALVQRTAEHRVRHDQLSLESQELDAEIANLAARETALTSTLAELAEGKRITAEERGLLEAQMNELRGRELESERAVDAAKNALLGKRNRLRALEDLHRRLEGVGTGPRALLSRKDPSILGLLADRLEAPEDLTAALAGLLGDQLQYVVVSNPARGLELLDELQRDRRGRAHVVPACPRYVAGVTRAVPAAEGVLGPLIHFLSFAREDEALVRSLVGEAILVDQPEHALQLVAARPGTTAVTLDGTVVRPNGVISGGSGDDVAAAMIEQKREMTTLASEVAQLTARQEKVIAAHTALRTRLTEVNTALDSARQGAHAGELAHVQAEKDLARTRSEHERALRREVALARELSELLSKIEENNLEEVEVRSRLGALTSQGEATQYELARAQETADLAHQKVVAQSSLVTERKVRLAQIREQVESARVASERLTASIVDSETRAQRLDQELTEAARSFGETAARLLLAKESLASAREEAQRSHVRLDEANELLEKVRGSIATREAELKRLREDVGSFEEAVHRHEMALTGLERDHDHLLSDVAVRFRGLNLARVVGDYHRRPPPDAEQYARIKELNQLIERMGPVNLDAQAEYEESERRFVDLSRQKDDIEAALVELDRAIKHMNKESRRRFKETFEHVNALFKDTFIRLFKGGRAELKLSDPDDLLNSGVDIIAQPPGKKLANIELMSGGEKALTAVALIFAIFRHKPSPFCVLDEVDAPLDEANVTRYNEAIRSMTDRSQFILITHIKKTMQMVDVLYGVTMGEPGVSRLVSVKVNDAAVERSQRTAGLGGIEAHVAANVA